MKTERFIDCLATVLVVVLFGLFYTVVFGMLVYFGFRDMLSPWRWEVLVLMVMAFSLIGIVLVPLYVVSYGALIRPMIESWWKRVKHGS